MAQDSGGWPDVQTGGTTVAQQVEAVESAYAEMERRYEAIESGQVRGDALWPVIVMIDEFRDFSDAVTEWYAASRSPVCQAKCPVLEHVSSIARKGRSAGIRLVIRTPPPPGAWMSAELRDNLSARVSLGSVTP